MTREEIEQAPWARRRRLPRPLAADRAPWERQPGESRRAYALFAVYRDLGPITRSLTETAQRTARSRAYLADLSLRWQWVFRVEQWDAQQERLRQEALRREQEEMLRRHAEVAVAALRKVALRLTGGYEQRGQKKVPVAALNPETMSAGDLARLADVAVKIERLARGLPTEQAEVSGTVHHDDGAITRRSLQDPEARRLVADLFDRLARRPHDEGEAAPDGPGAHHPG